MDLTNYSASWGSTNASRKSNLPPVTLIATVWTLSHALPSQTRKKYAIEWTDPSGKLTPPSVPLNIWVQTEHIIRLRNTEAQKSSFTGVTLCIHDVAPFGVWLFSHVRFDIILLTLALIIELEKHQETPQKTWTFTPTSRDELKGAVDTCTPGNASSSAQSPYPSLVVFDLDGIETRTSA